jgi:tetratricopeptide (TPR) repeat protein
MKFDFRKDCSAIILVLLTCATVAAQMKPLQRQSLTAREIAQKTLPSVVIVVVKNSSRKVQSFGSGFFVKGNVVATNYHVIDDASEVGQLFIRFPRSKYEYRVIRLLAIHVKDDLALLDVGNFAQSIVPLALGESQKMSIGDVVYAAGNPEGLTGTFSQGIVSGRRQMDGTWYIQISAPVSHGSSGGPVLNEFGEVIGVAAVGLEEGQNLNFAAPSSSLRAIMSRSVDSPDPDQRQMNQTLAEWRLKNKDQGESEKSSLSSEDSLAKLYFDQGVDLFKKEKYEEAIHSFFLCSLHTSDYSEAAYYAALCHILLDRYPSAITALKTAIKLNPRHADAHYMLGLAYIVVEDKASALDEYAILKRLDNAQAQELFKRIYQ